MATLLLRPEIGLVPVACPGRVTATSILRPLPLRYRKQLSKSFGLSPGFGRVHGIAGIHLPPRISAALSLPAVDLGQHAAKASGKSVAAAPWPAALTAWHWFYVPALLLTAAVVADLMNRGKKTELADITAADTETNEAVLTGCTTLVDVPFQPGVGLSNGHLQTLYATSIRPAPALRYRRQCVRCPDGGFLALDWAVPHEDLPEDAPTLMLLPGVVAAGSGHATMCCYAAAAIERGLQPVVVNSRGCGKSPVTNDRLCEVSTTDDIRVAVQTLYESRPLTRVLAAGFGFGANSLVTYLGEEGSRAHIDAAVSISNPFDVKACVYNLSKSWGRWYDRSLAGSFVELLRPHTALFEGSHRGYDVPRALKATSLREFDEAITIHSLGFASADDYYDSASCAPLLHKVVVPTLCLQARDDPICPLTAVPFAQLQRNRHITVVVTEAGGHAGWLAGSVAGPESWAEPATLEWLQAMASLGRERKSPASMPIAAARTVALNRARMAAAATAAAHAQRMAATAGIGVPPAAEAPSRPAANTGGNSTASHGSHSGPTIGEMLEARDKAGGGADASTTSASWRGRSMDTPAAWDSLAAPSMPLDAQSSHEPEANRSSRGGPAADSPPGGNDPTIVPWLRSTSAGSNNRRAASSNNANNVIDSASMPSPVGASDGSSAVTKRRLVRQPAGGNSGTPNRANHGIASHGSWAKQGAAAVSSVLAAVTAQRQQCAAAIEGALGPTGAKLRTASLPLRLGSFLLAVALLASPGFLALAAGHAAGAALPMLQQLETASAIVLYMAIHAAVWWWGRLVCGYRAPFKTYGLLPGSLDDSGLQDGVLAMACGLTLVAVLYALPLAAHWATLAPALPTPEAFATAAGMSLGVAWVEELLFRGWLAHEAAHLGRHVSALLSAAVFAAVHGSLVAAPGLALLGLALTGLTRAAAGRLALPIGLHAGVVAGKYGVIGASGQLRGIRGRPLHAAGSSTQAFFAAKSAPTRRVFLAPLHRSHLHQKPP
eukprot:jgi/Mesvir1/340/Mv22744-RA.3